MMKTIYTKVLTGALILAGIITTLGLIACQQGDAAPKKYKITKGEYSLLEDSLAKGDFTVSPEKSAAAGTTITLWPTAKDGYAFTGWVFSPDTIVAAETKAGTEVFTFTMPAANVTIDAIFIEDPREVIDGGALLVTVPVARELAAPAVNTTNSNFTAVLAEIQGALDDFGQYLYGSEYTLVFDLSPKEGYKFAAASTIVTVNNRKIQLGYMSSNLARLYVPFKTATLPLMAPDSNGVDLAYGRGGKFMDDSNTLTLGAVANSTNGGHDAYKAFNGSTSDDWQPVGENHLGDNWTVVWPVEAEHWLMIDLGQIYSELGTVRITWGGDGNADAPYSGWANWSGMLAGVVQVASTLPPEASRTPGNYLDAGWTNVGTWRNLGQGETQYANDNPWETVVRLNSGASGRYLRVKQTGPLTTHLYELDDNGEPKKANGDPLRDEDGNWKWGENDDYVLVPSDDPVKPWTNWPRIAKLEVFPKGLPATEPVTLSIPIELTITPPPEKGEEALGVGSDSEEYYGNRFPLSGAKLTNISPAPDASTGKYSAVLNFLTFTYTAVPGYRFATDGKQASQTITINNDIAPYATLVTGGTMKVTVRFPPPAVLFDAADVKGNNMWDDAALQSWNSAFIWDSSWSHTYDSKGDRPALYLGCNSGPEPDAYEKQMVGKDGQNLDLSVYDYIGFSLWSDKDEKEVSTSHPEWGEMTVAGVVNNTYRFRLKTATKEFFSATFKVTEHEKWQYQKLDLPGTFKTAADAAITKTDLAEVTEWSLELVENVTKYRWGVLFIDAIIADFNAE